MIKFTIEIDTMNTSHRTKFYSVRIILLFAVVVFYPSISKGDSYFTIPQYITGEATLNTFRIASDGQAATIYVDPDDWKGVIRTANDLSEDIRKVSGAKPAIMEKLRHPAKGSILVGTIGKSKIIDQLIASKKINVSGIKGQWESFIIQTVDGNLVVAGSDKRGTIYGIYDISEKIGVNPWYWWADAPIKKMNHLFVKDGRYVQKSPKVKYRGIFINDESPSFTGWCTARFGGVNSKMYVHLFELLLRLKANYLWPAMWSNAFNEDDPMDPVLADEYGIVMGTSHHEPMMRAHKEYTSRRQEIGDWDYATNKKNIDKFFIDGLERNKNFDNLITIGMRGDGDKAMGKGDDKENIKVLKDVIDGQRKIIHDIYKKDPAEVPQLWAIFTEVQRYYDAGFTVPDDVTLLFCDNNWGYIRRTGPEKEKNRKGGMGLYYHIDMNGGPWNDRWVNTTTIPKLREQLNLAYQTGLDRIWIINVGDLKPKELPIDFIMRFAWNPNAIPADKTMDYLNEWAANIFGKEHAGEIADVVSKYSKYNLMRKPEVQHTTIFSHVNYHEADRMMKLWHDVESKAEALEATIAPEAKDAYFELVLYPVKASAGLAEMYYAAGKNNLYAKQGRVTANDYTNKAQTLFELDKRLSKAYNDSIAGGKWKNMMSDIHIGYEQWSMPKENKLPEMQEVVPLSVPTMGVATEGCELAWPGTIQSAQLPIFDQISNRSYYIDIFNRGIGSFDFTAKADKPWIILSQAKGKVEKENRIMVSVDWSKLKDNRGEGTIEIMQNGTVVPVKVTAEGYPLPVTKETYFGGLGEFSIPANKYNANVKGKDAKWVFLPNLGRTEGCMGISPVTAPSATLATAPRLEYKIYIPAKGQITAFLGILPVQDINPGRGLRIAASIDDGQPQIIDARQGLVDEFKEYTEASLSMSKVLKPLPTPNQHLALVGYKQPRRNDIFDNMRWLNVGFNTQKAGMHTLKIYMIDPEIVLEKIVINPDDNYPSYFGAPPVQQNSK